MVITRVPCALFGGHSLNGKSGCGKSAAGRCRRHFQTQLVDRLVFDYLSTKVVDNGATYHCTDNIVTSI